MRVFLFLLYTCVLVGEVRAAYKLESIIHTQEVNSPESEVLDEYSDINSEMLEDLTSSSSNIDELLKASPAASTARGPRSSSESPQVRGLDDNKIYVKVDGVRENFQDGHSSFMAIDTENLKKVKVNRSSSQISQTGSIGGGVEFITKSTRDILKKNKSHGAEFSYKTSSVNQEKSYNAKALSQSKQFSNYISFSQAMAENSKLSNGETLDNSSYEDFSALYKASFLKKYSFKLEYFERKDDAPTDPSLNPPTMFKDLQSDNITKKMSLSIGYNFDSLKIHSYISSYSQEKKDRDSKEVTIKEIETSSFKFDKEYSNITFGSEIYKDKLEGMKPGADPVDGELTPGYPSAESDNYMGYVDGKFQLKKTATINLGLRADAYNMRAKSNEFRQKSDSHISKLVGIRSMVTNGTDVYFNYSEGFNAPTVNEVYASGIHIPSDEFFFRDNEFISNIELEHETSVTQEVGIKSQLVLSNADLLELGLSFYENKVKNYITREQIDKSIFDEENGTTQFVNLSRVDLYGAEAQVSYIRDSIKVGLTYNKVRGKDRETGEFIEDLPADTYRLNTKYYLDKYRLSFGYELTYTEEQNRTNPATLQRTDTTPDSLVQNIFMQKEINDFRLNFRINNLTDIKYKKHASFLYETKRDYKFGLKYKINTF